MAEKEQKDASSSSSPLRSLRCAVMLSPHLPGWTAQRPDLFSSSALLHVPTIVAWSTSDSMLYVNSDPSSGTCGPPECLKLWQPGFAAEVRHAGPGHRPLPRDATERTALCQRIVKLIRVECSRVGEVEVS